MSATWSDEQRRCLDALGYTLYRPVAATALHDNVETPLMRALLLAACLDPAMIADAAGWLRAQRVPSLALLRSDPAAKRALWPRLRALRQGRTRP
jgi:hypothetical protein